MFVGQVFGDRLIFGIIRDTTFVAATEIEDGKKWLGLIWAILPVCFFAGLIPNIRRRSELVVLFTVVGAVVACVTKIRRERLHEIRQFRFATHVVRAKRRLIHTSDDGRAARRTYSSGRIRIRVTHAFGRKLVDVRRDRVFIAKTMNVETDVLARDPNDVGALFVLCDDNIGHRQRDEKSKAKLHSEAWICEVRQIG